ncbi:MAG: T9SS type A sorting domain-containing protein [Flavobacteriales bacterium]
MKLPVLFSALCASALLHAQAPTVEWMRTAGEFSQFGKYLSAVDATGHIYTVARATNPDYGNSVTVTDEGMVLARYDSTGAIDWARGITTDPNEFDNVTGIVTTTNGEVWVAGMYTTSTLTIDAFVLNNNGGQRSFLARFDATGAAQDAFDWGGQVTSSTTVDDICIDALDRVYVTGSSSGTSITIDGITMTNPGVNVQLYALAFDANGTASWGTMSASPSGVANGRVIATDGSGNAYVSGLASANLVIDGSTLPVGNQDMAVLMAFNNTGAVTHMEVLADCMPMDMAVDDAGNAYVGGYVQNTAIFGSDTLLPSVLDGFVAAFPGDGTCNWVVGVEGAQDNEICYSVALDASRTHLIASGIFTFDAWFGPMHVQSGMVPSDGFIMHLDTAGTVNWVKDMTGNGPTLHAQAMYDTQDRIHTSGLTQSTQIYLGEITNITAPTVGFLARFDEIIMGVEPIGQQDDVLLYPNPGNGNFTLDLPMDAHTIIVEDAQGRLLQRMKVNSSAASFHIGTAGVYFVSVLSDVGRTVQRVVVD